MRVELSPQFGDLAVEPGIEVEGSADNDDTNDDEANAASPGWLGVLHEMRSCFHAGMVGFENPNVGRNYHSPVKSCQGTGRQRRAHVGQAAPG